MFLGRTRGHREKKKNLEFFWFWKLPPRPPRPPPGHRPGLTWSRNHVGVNLKTILKLAETSPNCFLSLVLVLEKVWGGYLAYQRVTSKKKKK